MIFYLQLVFKIMGRNRRQSNCLRDDKSRSQNEKDIKIMI